MKMESRLLASKISLTDAALFKAKEVSLEYEMDSIELDQLSSQKQADKPSHASRVVVLHISLCQVPAGS
jgi:hypothetical protein